MVELYTDGSFKGGNVGWGFVALVDGNIIYEDYGRLFGPEDLVAQRNVGGEMKAVMMAVSYAASCGFREITIYYDYLGCWYWVSGAWEPGNLYSQAYKKFVGTLCNRMDSVSWVHVKGHSGNTWNEYADGLAKLGAEGKTPRLV